MADDDDEDAFQATYDNGHWEWSEVFESLVFISDLKAENIEVIQLTTKAPTGTVEFRDDVDLIEQIRFRRRYQRKVTAGQPDVITIQRFTGAENRSTISHLWENSFAQSLKSSVAQDIKDIALYTAPLNIMSPTLINILHLASTERFIRSLIIYCQYYLQVESDMVTRMLQLETKVRTPVCDLIEIKYRDNLADLRLLVSKEYSTMLIGGSEFKKYHHMGLQKRRRSLSEKDARLFETLLRMCVQIVWLALGRKAFNQIELEINRLFKSEIFNAAEHNLRTNYLHKMSKEERAVLLGNCVRRDKKLNTRSPLMNEVFCPRPIEFRTMGLGVIKYRHLSPRLRYMKMAVCAPEEDLPKFGISVGILGLSRAHFDTMLRPLPIAAYTGKSKSTIYASSGNSPSSGRSTMSCLKKSQQSLQKIYEDIVLPDGEEELDFPEKFPDEPENAQYCSTQQRQRWLNRIIKLFRSQTS